MYPSTPKLASKRPSRKALVALGHPNSFSNKNTKNHFTVTSIINKYTLLLKKCSHIAQIYCSHLMSRRSSSNQLNPPAPLSIYVYINASLGRVLMNDVALLSAEFGQPLSTLSFNAMWPLRLKASLARHGNGWMNGSINQWINENSMQCRR